MSGVVGIYVTKEDLISLEHQASSLSYQSNGIARKKRQGNLRSSLLGRGGEFEKVRQYTLGDDIRNIDWNITAKERTPYVRVFNEETEKPLVVFVDQTESMFFATQKQLKSVVAARLASYVLWMASNKKRPVGAVILGDTESIVLRPKTSKRYLVELFTHIASYNQRLSAQSHVHVTKNLFEDELTKLSQTVSRDTQVVIVSDFLQMTEKGWYGLEALSRKNSVVAMPIYDGVVKALPIEGSFFAKNSDTQGFLSFDSLLERNDVEERVTGIQRMLTHKLKELGIPALMFSTYQSVDEQFVDGAWTMGGIGV
ncbi:DUF58 domain-containing protein [Vibrio parahaemolyticus]|uniref:DUF58 domain-containing protein n=1 Tax=Vibrio parahaemolyticus TaxID=670 RepID=UPI002405277D|nr:DUF58 domain-containing protein [Vibrio parahaemolyticus]